MLAAHSAPWLWALSLVHGSFAQWTVGQEVETASGKVQGHAAKSLPQVSEYLGIRFGQTTEGENRFMPPKPYTSTAKIVASDYGAGCPQTAASGFTAGIFPTKVSEDCLFLNVWTKPQTGEKKKAVLLWIYGGAFNIGDASMRGTNGAALANNQDIIVVSINYRVNVFGFPGAPPLPHFNPGFLDQRLAVQWTKNNIAAFGGDPERITLYGQSAGSMSVDDYAFSWTEDPIVNGFILSSGTALMGRGEVRMDQSKNWYSLSQKLGCGGQEAGAATVKCLQKKPWKDIYDKIPGGPVGGFGPSNDNKTLFADVYDRAKRGQFIKKPLLAGGNQQESMTPAAGGKPAFNVMICGSAETSKARALNGVPVWRYLHANAGTGSDMSLVFADGMTGQSKIFQSAWGAFIKDPAEGLTKFGWPKYSPTGNTLVRIGQSGAAVADFTKSNTYDGNCDFKL